MFRKLTDRMTFRKRYIPIIDSSAIFSSGLVCMLLYGVAGLLKYRKNKDTFTNPAQIPGEEVNYEYHFFNNGNTVFKPSNIKSSSLSFQKMT